MTKDEAKKILNVLKESERAYRYSKEEVVKALDMAIKALEPKTGHWAALSDAPYDCKTNYCPNCGAKMEG